MKLTDIIYSITTQFRQVENFIRYPFQIVSQTARRIAQDKLEEIELPLGQKTADKEAPEQERQRQRLGTDVVGGASQEGTRTSREAITERAPAKQRQTARLASVATSQSRTVEVLPPLPNERVITSVRRGRYQVIDRFRDGHRDGERVRLYEGIYLLNRKPVLIKEYLLPDRDFNQKERRERKEKFESLASLNLKTRVGQDFRLITPCDAIAPRDEKCCYLIFEQSLQESSTLREYLAQNGSMTAKQVRQVLNQVLQTLCFLHTQRIRLSTEEVKQGLPHGNLSLDSLLIGTNNQQDISDEQQFFIYVSDLALWEHLFNSPASNTVNPSVSQDLIDLGYVSFYLLSGDTVDRTSSQPLDPKVEQHWPVVGDRALKKFIRRLLGLDKPFMDAWQARQALLESQPDQGEEQADILSQSDETEQVKKSRVFRLLLIIFALGLLGGFVGGLIWLGWRWLERGQSPSKLIADSNSPCCLTEVPKVPTGDLTYITDSQGTWRYVLNGQQLASYDKTLEKELKERDPRLSNYTLRISSNNVIDELRAGKASFALTTWRDIPPDWGLEQEKIAYDGLVVFVVFRDAQTRGSLPKALNGKISIEQLRALYTGEEKYLELSDNSKISVKLNMPILDDPKAVELFKQLIFKENPEQAQKFEEVKKTISKRERTNQMLDNMFRDFDDDKTIEIGFGFLSKIFGQCSVYPLTVVEGGREAEPLIQNNGKPIEPTIDLCNDKGSYSPNAKAFKSEQYPLSETLVVVYPKGDSLAGKSFAALLTTDEGQYLLSEVGLVPNNRYNDPSK